MNRKKLIVSVAVMALVALASSSFAEIEGPIVIEGRYLGESPPMRDIDAEAAFAAMRESRGERMGTKEVPNRLDVLRKQTGLQRESRAPGQLIADSVAQLAPGSSLTPPPRLSFEGMGNADNGQLTGFVIWPPDNDGDVGKFRYVQMNNISFEVFNKRTGQSIMGPLPNVALWASAVDDQGIPQSICAKSNDGDPIVLYDQQAQRWVLSQFAIGAFEDGPPYYFDFGGYQCVAVSTTRDPRGSYHLYEFEITPDSEDPFQAGLNDYPKLSVWPDGIHLSTNEFIADESSEFSFTFRGASATALNKRAMYRGRPATAIKFFIPRATDDADPFHFSLQPSHWEGNKVPKIKGKFAPNIYIQNMDFETWGPISVTQPDGLHHWAFKVNFRKPDKSMFMDLGLIETPPFDSLGAFLYDAFGLAVAQPDTDNKLDILGQFTMTRAQYRSFGRHDSIVGNVSTCVLPSGDTCVDEAGVLDESGQIAVRWFELRKTGKNGSWKTYQAGTYAPDGEARWMASAAMDRKGNIGVAYSASSDTLYPSVRYSARNAGDPKNMLGTEQSCVEGTESQTAVLSSGPTQRWGDYSTISVDPQNGCTFWYTNEFYDETIDDCFTGGCWKTQICSFQLDSCGGPKN